MVPWYLTISSLYFHLQRVSEMCYFAVSQLLMLGKSIITNANKVEEEDDDDDEDAIKIQWPEDSVEKAEIIRLKALLMIGYVDALSKSFITGWPFFIICPNSDISQKNSIMVWLVFSYYTT